MRLRRSSLSAPGITRRRRGRGFSYHQGGATVTDAATVDRIKALVIPPAWESVWICPYPNGHIQAVGTDAAGRRQYLYHPQWRHARDIEKFERVRSLARHLPAFRARVAADLGGRGLGRDRVVAVALRLLDRGVLRVGGEEYAEVNGSHGAATLHREHVHVRGSRLALRFPAKGGSEQSVELDDAELTTVVRSLLRSRAGSPRLLVYRSAREWREVRADDVNARFKELVGDRYTVKDLRTWTATVLAAVELASRPEPTSQVGRRRMERAAYQEVAEHLGDTPAVARRSYVDPRIVERFEQGATIRSTVHRVGADLADERARTALERGVLRLLRED